MRRVVLPLPLLVVALSTVPASMQSTAAMQSPTTPGLRIIAFGAHPDDAEPKASGVAALRADLGHKVKLVPSLDNRKTVAPLVREWPVDIVLGHRPHDYHPDHRDTGELMDDTAVVVVAPFFVPDTRPVERNPVFLYYSDAFFRPSGNRLGRV